MPALAEAIQSEIVSVEGFGWAWCSWQIADAADYGAATRRERAWMVATRYEKPRYAEPVNGDSAAREMWAHVLKKTGKQPDWTPELDRRIEPYQGAGPADGDRRSGTGSPRGLVGRHPRQAQGERRHRQGDGRRFLPSQHGRAVRHRTVVRDQVPPGERPPGRGNDHDLLHDLGVLVGFPRDYPWTYIPARAGAKGTRNIAQMIADAASPFMGAPISAAVQGTDWYEPVAAYQAATYRLGTRGRKPAAPVMVARPRQAEQMSLFTETNGKQLLRKLFAPRTPTAPANVDRVA